MLGRLKRQTDPTPAPPPLAAAIAALTATRAERAAVRAELEAIPRGERPARVEALRDRDAELAAQEAADVRTVVAAWGRDDIGPLVDEHFAALADAVEAYIRAVQAAEQARVAMIAEREDFTARLARSRAALPWLPDAEFHRPLAPPVVLPARGEAGELEYWVSATRRELASWLSGWRPAGA
jgi:hypothetical protein